MIAVALKGLAGRKVRALLTAFAVVIGVSMVSGTFILTDTMQKTFDGLFAASYEETDAVIAGKEIVEHVDQRLGDGPRSRCSPRCGRCREVEAAGGTVSPAEVNAADIIGRDGKAVAKESLGVSIDAANPRFSPLKLKTGDWPAGPEPGRDRRRHRRRRSTTRSATPSRSRRPAKTASYEITGTASLRRGRLARLRQHRGLGRQDRPDAARPRGPLRHDLDRREGGHVAGRARPRRAAARPGHARGQGQRQAGRGGVRRSSTRACPTSATSCSASAASRCSSARS